MQTYPNQQDYTSREIVIIDADPITALNVAPPGDPLNGAINAWLAECRQSSVRTAETYAYMMAQFCTILAGKEYNLFAPPRTIAAAAQLFAESPASGITKSGKPSKKNGQPVAAATHNLRLAALSSFYLYAIRHEVYGEVNPIDRVKRMKRQAYKDAKALAFQDGEIEAALNAIPLDGDSNVRDLAMLSLTLFTGRRLAEIAGLRLQDITVTKSELVIEFRKTKGNKTATNHIPANVRAYVDLLRWLKKHYGSNAAAWHADGVMFPSLSKNSYGRQMSPQGIEQRAARWLPTKGKFHALRHTFASNFLKVGGSVHDLSKALNHGSIVPTAAYADRLDAGNNQHIEAMAALYKGKKSGAIEKV